MSDDDDKIYIYSDLFSKNYSDDEKDDSYEREKQVYSASETKNAENEYSKLRAQNSTILNNYFDNDNIKNVENVKSNDPDQIDPILFPVNKNYYLNLFDGQLIENRHSIKLRKAGFYAIYVENNNNSKWDGIYFGLSRMQVELDYKLITKKNKDGGEYEKRNLSSYDNTESVLNTVGSEQEETENKNEETSTYNSNLNNEINKICKYNLDQTDILLDENNSERRRSSNFKIKNTNYYDNLMLQNKYTNSKIYDDDDDKNNTETYTCTFKTEDQIRVTGQKKKYIYLYNKYDNATLDLNVHTYMSLGMSILCKYSLLYCGKYNHIPRDPYTPFKKPVSILSLDGGGILTISTLLVLNRLETELRKEIGSEDIKLTDCFDMVCGTSAGGLISLALLREIDLQDISNMWPSTIKKVFEGNRNIISGIFFEGYDVNNVKDVFLERMGNKFMSSYKKFYCFVTATDVKHKPYKLFLLRNYTHKYNSINAESYDGINKVPLWLAAWATASAPTYLKGPSGEDIKKLGINIKPEIHLVDGALKASNPALIALEECARLNNKNLSTFIKEDLDTLVSIGTGQVPTKLTQSGTSSKSASTFEILINSTHLLTRANDTHREVLQRLADRENTYFRFNVPHIGDIEIDSQDVRDFDLISKATQDYLFDEKFYEIKRLAHKLANNYIRSKYL
ncbi:phospholipase A2, putative [Plasmodium sp. DRC-Itaito]|uniref:Phospholipase A2, putative n=1 Tax=Plasmodium gaboni TaxID=647221 RepID=A0ABY1UGS9_9APIC|nr:phospholipase A2, putative [Plasmodium gaboni]SOV20652.1 phospholipase A2, putative [Plasmodium sp. DRC-Itaito]